MSTAVELPKPHEHPADFTKPHEDHKSSPHSDAPAAPNSLESKSQQHPLLHQYDHSQMAKFYETCVSKLAEQMPKWNPSEWSKATPIPANGLSLEEQKKWPNPVVIGEKQRVYECFATLAKDLGEPMILMPNFDISDLQNFELFLDSLKTDGVNAIRKYKQYLSNKDMRKQEIDLVAVHARYGVILVEVKDSDYVDYKRRSRAKAMVGQTKSLFKSLGRLIAESKGLPISAESSVPVMEFVALPNVQERPQQPTPKPSPVSAEQPPKTEATPAPSSLPSAPASSSRQLNYLIKSDMESSAEFMKWWSKNVVEPKLEQEKWSEETKKVNKFDVNMLNALVALVNCIRANSILPVVYQESGSEVPTVMNKEEPQPAAPQQPEQPSEEKPKDEKDKDTSKAEQQPEAQPLQFQPALNIHAEFFKPKHEAARSLSKCLVLSKDPERIRKTICLQTLWLLLNDAQKKISVVCSELNKPYYEEFFARQRKIYSNYLNNVRFYTDVQSCETGEGATRTLKKDGEVWIFDANVVSSLPEMLERVKSLNSFWVFSTSADEARGPSMTDKLTELAAKLVDLDEDKEDSTLSSMSGPSSNSIKLPLRLQCDLLIIGDMISANQLKYLHKYLQTKSVPSQAGYYQQNAGNGSNNHHGHHGHHHQQPPHMQHLNFNPTKKFRTVKFIRGGSIDNIRNSLKMHDSIQAQCVIMHVGDEDLFKTRYSVSTIERIKELATLVKEYCPKSFVVLSTLMRRQSRTENAATSEVNKGIIQFCKQTRDSLNCYYMQNQHFEPEYHTQGGRLLNNKGLKSYIDNILFVVDFFLIKNNKQH